MDWWDIFIPESLILLYKLYWCFINFRKCPNVHIISVLFHSRRMRNPQFFVSGKRPITTTLWELILLEKFHSIIYMLSPYNGWLVVEFDKIIWSTECLKRVNYITFAGRLDY